MMTHAPKRMTVLGMSGIGKTTLAGILAQSGWTHYSCDHRIGTHYMADLIIRDLRKTVEKDPKIKKLLDAGTLSLQGNIRVQDLGLLSQFIGKIGNPEQGGLALDEFLYRQELYHQAEINAVCDAADFADQAGECHFIHDSSGSLCEIEDDAVLAGLARHTDFVYIAADADDEKILIDRAVSYPKPLYYPADFLRESLGIYMEEQKIKYVALIDPDDFCRWVFPRLFYSRIPKYERIAGKYGVTIRAKDVARAKTESDILALIPSRDMADKTVEGA